MVLNLESEKSAVYTIGHSNHRIEHFIKLLRSHRIVHLFDVRKIPFSRYNPHFNREHLKRNIIDAGIDYQYRGDTLSLSSEWLDENQNLSFDHTVESPLLIGGIRALMHHIKDAGNTTIMCAEKSPLNCHRFFVLTFMLRMRDVTVIHIMPDGSLMNNKELEDNLLAHYQEDYVKPDLFSEHKTSNQLISDIYRDYFNNVFL